MHDLSLIERIAEVVHEANRAQQKHAGEELNPHWDELSADLKDLTRSDVVAVLDGNSAAQLNTVRLKQRRSVPEAQLPPEQRVKDAVFVAIVRALAGLAAPALAESFRAGFDEARAGRPRPAGDINDSHPRGGAYL